MNPDDFKKLLEENNAKLLSQVDKKLDERLGAFEQRIDKKLDERLETFEQRVDEKLDANSAKLYGQITRYTDGKIDELRDEMREQHDRVMTTLDGIARRMDDDDQERAIISGQLDRHKGWIDQLADTTGTELATE